MEKNAAQVILDRTAQFFNTLLNGAAAPAPDASGMPAAPQKMMEAKLKDGTVVEVTDMNVGGVVTIAGMPAPVGEHILEDGTKIILADNGVISEIEMPLVAPIPAAPTEDMSAKFAAFESATNEKFASYENKFADYEVKLSQANKVIQGLMDISKLLVEAPQGKPDSAVPIGNNFAAQTPVDPKEKWNILSKQLCS